MSCQFVVQLNLIASIFQYFKVENITYDLTGVDFYKIHVCSCPFGPGVFNLKQKCEFDIVAKRSSIERI